MIIFKETIKKKIMDINILYKRLIVVLITLTIQHSVFSQILISNNSAGTPDGSAILEVQSDSKGLLIPRITTAQRFTLANTAVEGLLVFDSDEHSFFIFGNSKWTDLSMSAEIWSKSASSVYLTNSTDNIGIGTLPSSSKFVVQANTGSAADDVLFEVKDESGIPVFRVTSEGVRVYVKDKTKGVSGGFAVGQYGSLKSVGDEFFTVTPFQTTVNTLPGAKASSGGFAVGQYASLKGGTVSTNFYTNPGETRIYTDKAEKGVSGGFAVGQYGSLKAPGDKYMHVTIDNTFIGNLAGLNTDGIAGINNVFIGSNAGQLNTSGSGNIFIGNNAGSTVVSSNKLYIDNASSSSDVALIYGDFNLKGVNLNGRLRFNTGGVAGGNTISMPTSRGAITGENFLTINHTTGNATWNDITPIITEIVTSLIPEKYVPPILYTLYDDNKDFEIDGTEPNEEKNIGTLVVKTYESIEGSDIFLPIAGENRGRTIVIKNYREKSPIHIFPNKKSSDEIQSVGTDPPYLEIFMGWSYTLQAEYDMDTKKGFWYINSIVKPIGK